MPSSQQSLRHGNAPDSDEGTDALLLELSRPLTPEVSPRAHADFLLSVLEDGQLNGLVGSDGRVVRTVAIQALMALGYPYALEIPPDLLGQAEPAQAARSRFAAGTWLILGNAVLASLGLCGLYLERGRAHEFNQLVILLGMVALTTLLPLFVSVKGRKKGLRALQLLGSAMLGLVGVAVALWASDSLFTWHSRGFYPTHVVVLSLFALFLSGLQLVGALFLSGRERQA